MIGVVTFYHEEGRIGGGHVPALALVEWAKEFGVAHKFELIKYEGNTANLNCFEKLFFATPPIYYPFQIQDLNTDFIMMVHGENDRKLYGDVMQEMMKSHLCMGVIDIEQYGGWHPCCMPDDIPNGPIEPSEGSGILYAARITKWLNVDLFMDLADEIGGHIMGPCQDTMLAQKVAVSSSIQSDIGVFDKADINYDDYQYFWDCAGYLTRPFHIPRLSLSAVAALNNGLTPIVFSDQIPDYAKDVCVGLDRFGNLDDHLKAIEKHDKKSYKHWYNFNKMMSKRSLRRDVEHKVNVIIEDLLE